MGDRPEMMGFLESYFFFIRNFRIAGRGKFDVRKKSLMATPLSISKNFLSFSSSHSHEMEKL
jgi:hypothetical protein